MVLGDERLSVISLYRTCQGHRWTFATSPSIGSVQKCILQWAVSWEGGKHRHVTSGQWFWTSFPALTSCVTVNRFASVFSFVKRKRWHLPQMDVSGNSWDHGERTERTTVIPGCWQMLLLQREVPVERLRGRLPESLPPLYDTGRRLSYEHAHQESRGRVSEATRHRLLVTSHSLHFLLSAHFPFRRIDPGSTCGTRRSIIAYALHLSGDFRRTARGVRVLSLCPPTPWRWVLPDCPLLSFVAELLCGQWA